MKDEYTVKVGHIADCHLCCRQYGYESRGADFLQGVVNAVDALNAKGVKLVLCAGDLLDTVNPGSKVCLTQLDELRGRLASNGQLMVVTAGNHDNAVPHWCSGMHDTPDSGGILYVDGQKFEYPVEGAPRGVTVTGRRYAGNDEYTAWMSEEAEPADILMYHGDTLEASPYPEPGTPSVKDFAAEGKWRLVAAGHIHKRFYSSETGPDGRKTVFSYSGSTELTDGSEDPDKSANMYTMVYDGTDWVVDDMERVPFKTRTVQHFRIESSEDLEKACAEVEPGAIVFVVFDDKELHSVHSVLASAAERKAHAGGSTQPSRTIFRMRPMLHADELKVMERIRGGRCISLVEYMNTVAGDYISEEEAGRGMRDLCVSMLDSGCDHKAALEKYISDSLEGSVVL